MTRQEELPVRLGGYRPVGVHGWFAMAASAREVISKRSTTTNELAGCLGRNQREAAIASRRTTISSCSTSYVAGATWMLAQ